MTFATRSDLLARSNARRLLQLAVPTDAAMPPDDALRVAIDGGSLAGYTPEEQAALTLALDAIDKALADADALIVSHGIPASPQTTAAALSQLARMSSTIAMYYLQGAERMTDTMQKAYDSMVSLLKQHARGDINLAPVDPPPVPAVSEAQVTMESAPRRYGNGQVVADGDF